MRRWRALGVVALFGVACSDASGDARRSSCEDALANDEWTRAIDVCIGPQWELHARLAQAWIAFENGDRDDALAIAMTLLDTALGADASLIAGLVEGPRPGSEAEARGRAHLRRAFDSFQGTRNHKRAARAAMGLSRAPRPEQAVEDRVHWAQIGLDQAELSQEVLLIGRALLALGEAYDTLGNVEEARNRFIEAEETLKDLPDELAWAWFKHALFILDIDSSDADLEVVLMHLDTAARTNKGRSEALDFAISLNRAVALSRQGRYDEAERELDKLAAQTSTKLEMVRGIVAARRGDLNTATRAFEAARAGDIEPDYRWNIETELARLHRNAGRIEEAEMHYRKAIVEVEQMRGQPKDLKLRPWVLDRRRQPYLELLEMLAADGKALEALAIAESLHARTWLDAVLGRPATGRGAIEDALRDVRLTAARATPQLSASDIATLVGGREALVFATVDDGLWRFHLANGKVQVQRFGSDALKTIESYRDDLDDDRLALRVSEILLPADLTAIDEPLVLVGDAAWRTPFAALPWRGRPFVEARATAYLPGLAALRCSEGSWDKRRVVLGDADGNLREAAEEVSRLAKRFSVPAHVGAAATWEVLRASVGADLLHVAVHGEESDGSMALALSGTDVTASEILEARIGPKVVVLAGCNTADALATPESWSGFPSAFLAAGSRFVISTLQSIEDTSAARFVDAYYQQPETIDPARRLAAAQRTVMDSLPAAQWASFVAWGSPTCDFR